MGQRAHSYPATRLAHAGTKIILPGFQKQTRWDHFFEDKPQGQSSSNHGSIDFGDLYHQYGVFGTELVVEVQPCSFKKNYSAQNVPYISKDRNGYLLFKFRQKRMENEPAEESGVGGKIKQDVVLVVGNNDIHEFFALDPQY